MNYTDPEEDDLGWVEGRFDRTFRAESVDLDLVLEDVFVNSTTDENEWRRPTVTLQERWKDDIDGIEDLDGNPPSSATLGETRNIRRVDVIRGDVWKSYDGGSESPMSIATILAERQKTVCLCDMDDDLGEIDHVLNPSEYDWYPKTRTLTEYTGVGDITALEIGHRVEVVEDLLGDDNDALADFVEELATHHSALLHEVRDDYDEAKEERGDRDVEIVRRISDWHEKHDEFSLEIGTPEEMRSYRDAAEDEADSLRSKSMRRVIYMDAVVGYVASEGKGDVWAEYSTESDEASVSGFVEWLEVETLREVWDRFGEEMFDDEELFSVEDRALADTLSALRYFHDS